MISVILAITLSQAGNAYCWKDGSGTVRCGQSNNRGSFRFMGRPPRAWGRSASGLFFELAPLSGAGLTAACTGGAITSVGGTAISWTRASAATCSTVGNATTGITPGTMASLTNNQPRVEFDGVGPALRIEETRTNDCLRNQELDNVAWTATATVLADQQLSPLNATTVDRLTDSSGVAIQSVCQTIATSSATLHSVSAYVGAGTLAAGSLTMVGTGSSTGDCTAAFSGIAAATSYTRVSCVSPAAYAGTLTAVTVCVNVGAVAGDTGNLFAWGIQHEIGAFPTSLILTVGTSVARSGETVAATIAPPASTYACIAATVTPFALTTAALNFNAIVGTSAGSQMLGQFAPAAPRIVNGTANATTTFIAGRQRFRATSDDTLLSIFYGSNTATSAVGAQQTRLTTNLCIGSGCGSTELNGLISAIQVDVSPSACQ